MPKTFFRGSPALILVVLACLQGASSLAEGPRFCPLLYSEKPVEFRRGTSTYDAFRSNANDYWNWSRTEISKYVSHDLLVEGLVAGDPHALNFGDLYLKDRKAQVTLVDLDDVGHAPFLVDFARLLTAIKLSGADVKSKEVWQYYLDGLFGRKAEETPGFIDDVKEKTHVDWLAEQKEFIAKNTQNGRMNKESLMLKPLEQLKAKDQARAQELIRKVSEIFPHAVVKDSAFKIKDTGGSQGLLRVWVLVDQDGVLSINEFKEMARPATQYFQPQAASQKDRMAEVTRQFWGDEDPSNFKVVTISDGDFWLRPRYKYELKFNPDKIDSEKKQEKFEEWSLYIAFILGRMHGAQAESAPLKKALQKQSDEVLEQIKDFSKAYRQRLGDKSK